KGPIMEPSRRKFLRDTSALAAASLATGKGLAIAQENATTGSTKPRAHSIPPTTRRGDMLYRELGSTGQEVSLIGLGGFHIGQQKNADVSISIIRTAIDRGITFLDNSWDYNNGKIERRMGEALKDGYR